MITPYVFSTTVPIIQVRWPWLNSWEAGRTSFNASKNATLDLRGFFHSSADFKFTTSDYGFGPQRRITLYHDNDVRVYSLDKNG
ncbi:hypothetical protein F511_13801 [Dorcoceras hygrometricum]|uniref:Uncharacterized protein n=1 Tax=Dorcoceras hygrometricum TaxID=472368 RepID=A0A2Z7DGC8_9LAMI|nr:hypothetical protein F511_13801 [Dorcoceras hygrometricum]